MTPARRLLPLLATALALAACGDDDGPGPVPDAGQDMRPAGDGGDMDATPDLGGGDAGPMGACEPADSDAVYETPADLPAFDDGQRGRPVRCTAPELVTAATVAARAAEREYAGRELTHGTRVTVFSYRTTRSNGAAALATAALYLPEEAPAEPLPLIVYAHPTSGNADACAPSHYRLEDHERAIYPLVGMGHAVVATDYIGLGTEGTPVWLVPDDEAHAVLDSARAALAIAPEGMLSGQLFLSGHSQGGHAALASQALARTYAPDLDIVGVAALAPVWIDLRLFGLMMFLGSYTLSEPDGWNVVYSALYFTGTAAALDGENAAYDMFPASHRDRVREVLETQCLDDLRPSFEAIAPTVNRFYDEGFRNSVGNCYAGVGCDELGTTWLERFDSSRPPLDPDGAPLWMIIGSLDRYITNDRISCVLDEIRETGATVEGCAYTGIDHNHTPLASVEWISDWVEALRDGGSGAVPTCGDAPISPCGGSMADAGPAADAGPDGG